LVVTKARLERETKFRIEFEMKINSLVNENRAVEKNYVTLLSKYLDLNALAEERLRVIEENKKDIPPLLEYKLKALNEIPKLEDKILRLETQIN